MHCDNEGRPATNPVLTPETKIVYLKSDSKDTIILARGRRFLIRIGITELAAQLHPTRFIRMHRAALINLDLVEWHPARPAT